MIANVKNILMALESTVLFAFQGGKKYLRDRPSIKVTRKLLQEKALLSLPPYHLSDVNLSAHALLGKQTTQENLADDVIRNGTFLVLTIMTVWDFRELRKGQRLQGRPGHKQQWASERRPTKWSSS